MCHNEELSTPCCQVRDKTKQKSYQLCNQIEKKYKQRFYKEGTECGMQMWTINSAEYKSIIQEMEGIFISDLYSCIS